MPRDNIQTVKLAPDGPPESPRPGRYYELPDGIGPALCVWVDPYLRFCRFEGADRKRHWLHAETPMQGYILTRAGGV